MEETNQRNIEFVFKDHYRELILLSYSYVGCMDQAQDIVQDVFVRLLTKENPSPILNLKAYAWRSVKNNSWKHISRSIKLESIEESRFVPIEKDEPQNCTLDVRLQQAINSLPPRCKHVFELCAIDGHKYKCTADSLGISVNTVKTQMKKAYKILRHNLAEIYLILVFFGFNG